MDVKIEKLVYGGEGLAHHDGATVFVPFVLPAERASVVEVERHKKFVRAHLERVLEASPERTTARCPHFLACGGCHYQHIPYEAQLRFKSEILQETLRRIGRIDWPGKICVHASPAWGYRNRAQWKVRPLRVGGRPGIGYFRAGSSALEPVEECALLSPLLERTLAALREALAKNELPGGLLEIEAFADASDEKLLLTIAFTEFPSRADGLAEKFRALLPGLETLLLHEPAHEKMELFGPGFLIYEAGGARYRVGHLSFFQVNRFLVEELRDEVAGEGPHGLLALDLFAGVGLFSAALARNFERVVAVESNPAAERDLETNAANFHSVQVHGAEVERFLEMWRETPDLVVLDPPRAGVARGALARLSSLAPRRIVYLSCDPSTLARDLALLLARDYAIEEVHLFDLFPQTYHIESLVRLSRRS